MSQLGTYENRSSSESWRCVRMSTKRINPYYWLRAKILCVRHLINLSMNFCMLRWYAWYILVRSPRAMKPIPLQRVILFHQGGQWWPGSWADLTKKPALGRHHFDSMDLCARTMGRPQIEDPTQFLAPSLPRRIRWNELKRIKKC